MTENIERKNPKIGFVVASEGMQNEPKLSIDQPLDMILLSNLPNNYSFIIHFSIVHLYFDVNYDFKVYMYDPNGNLVINAGQQGMNIKSEIEQPLKENSTILSMDVKNQEFQFEGDHVIKIDIWESDDKPNTHYSNEIVLPVIKRG